MNDTDAWPEWRKRAYPEQYEYERWHENNGWRHQQIADESWDESLQRHYQQQEADEKEAIKAARDLERQRAKEKREAKAKARRSY